MVSTETHAKRFRFIPYRRAEIIDMLAEEGDGRFDAAQFRAFAQLLLAMVHFEFHDELEQMKGWYAPFNPDSTSRNHPPRSETELSEFAGKLADALSATLEKGNYERLTKTDVDHAREHGSLIQLRVEVDFDDFEELVLYARGEAIQQVPIRRWWQLRPRPVEVPIFDRVCLYVRFHSEAGQKRRTGLAFQPGTSILKLFRNIPIADLEMLFPNCAIRMRSLDKLMLGVPAFFGGVPVVLKLGPALVAAGIALGITTGNVKAASLIPGMTGLVVLGLYLFRQWDKFKNRKVLFLKVLSENLYFRNLDNNEGVLTHLVDEAEEEECKEALLAYAFLLWAGEALDAKELDQRIERWFVEKHDLEIDFEVSDAIEKLQRFELVRRGEDGLEPVPLAEALRALDARWDNYFLYNNESGRAPTKPASDSEHAP